MVVFALFLTTSAFVGNVPVVNATDINNSSNNSVGLEAAVMIVGDVNGDGVVNLGDGLYLANNVLLVPGYEEIDEAASDVNGDGDVNLDDALYLINHAMHVSEYEILH